MLHQVLRNEKETDGATKSCHISTTIRILTNMTKSIKNVNAINITLKIYKIIKSKVESKLEFCIYLT